MACVSLSTLQKSERFEKQFDQAFVSYEYEIAKKILQKWTREQPRSPKLYHAYIRLIEKHIARNYRIKYLDTLFHNIISTPQSNLLPSWYFFMLETASKYQSPEEALKSVSLAKKKDLQFVSWVPAVHQLIQTALHGNFNFKLLDNLKNLKENHLLVLSVKAFFHEYFGDISKAHSLIEESGKIYSDQEFIKFHGNKVNSWMFDKARIEFLARHSHLDLARETLDSFFLEYETFGIYWAYRLQLIRGSSRFEVFQICELIQKGLKRLPRSGELLCELARMHMNPTKLRPEKTDFCHIPYDFSKAEPLLIKAIKLTPQYGDSFIELAKYYIVMRALGGGKGIFFENKLKQLKTDFLLKKPKYGFLYDQCHNTVFPDLENTWDLIIRRIESHLDFLESRDSFAEEDASEATFFENHGSAFGIRLSNSSYFGPNFFENRIFLIQLLRRYPFFNGLIRI